MPDHTETKIKYDRLLQYQTLVEEEKQTIVHCCFPATIFPDMLIRIWPSTFLVDDRTGHRGALLFQQNISLSPYWTQIPPYKDYWFTLIFGGLPADCRSFDLREEIAEEGGFWVKNIPRNSSDIYRIQIT